MEPDLTDPFGGEEERSISADRYLPPDPSWWGFIDGVWRRLTDPNAGTITRS